MRRLLAVATGAISAFLIFWFVRLLVVTGFLLHTRAGGSGAYAGAVVFPVLAVAFGWLAWRLWH